MSRFPLFPRRRVLAAWAATGSLVLTVGLPVAAQTSSAATPDSQTITWRQTSVRTELHGFTQVRRGVAMIGNREPATIMIRMWPSAPPSDGRVPMTQEAVYRFEDGATFSLIARTVVPVRPDGSVATTVSEWTGTFTGGTGRFTGIAGTVSFTGRSGLDPTSDGVLADNFGRFTATYTLGK